MSHMRRVLPAAVSVALLAGAGTLALASPPRGVEKWAVLVGINHYQGRTHPNYGAVGDVDDYRQVLLDNGWPADHILALTDGAATQANVRAAFRRLHDHRRPRTFAAFRDPAHLDK